MVKLLFKPSEKNEVAVSSISSKKREANLNPFCEELVNDNELQQSKDILPFLH